MDTQTIILPNGKTATLAATRILTPAKDQTPKVVKFNNCRVAVFFIGGAGDKESYYMNGPFGNIKKIYEGFQKRIDDEGLLQFYKTDYLDYSEVRGSWDIDEHIYKGIPDKSTPNSDQAPGKDAPAPDKAAPVYIVGHSLGAWNGAHLSRILSEKGYKVEMLITLDPVGEGFLVWAGSDIHFSQPEPISDFWINIRATPKNPDSSDAVADFGEQWGITSGPNINVKMNVNHADAPRMFDSPLNNGPSASDWLFESIKNYINEGCRV